MYSRVVIDTIRESLRAIPFGSCRRTKTGKPLVVLLLLVLSPFPVAAEDHPGAAIYGKHCASCHDRPESPRVPSTADLREMDRRSIWEALTRGVMRAQAEQVPRGELRTLISYLAAADTDSGEWLAGMMCPKNAAGEILAAEADFAMFGGTLAGDRALSARRSGLAGADIDGLELAWAIGLPRTRSLRASGVISGNTLFYAATDVGTLLALDVRHPCVLWQYSPGSPLRSSVSLAQIDAKRHALIFADSRGQVHAVDPATGSRIWQVEGRHSDRAMITGAPVVADGVVVVPVSGSGVTRAMNPEYECCAEHGAVVALDSATGDRLWTYHTMPDADYTGEKNSAGVKLRGPSGAPIWSSPTVDVKNRRVYVTTGQNTSLPATPTSDAVLALSLDDGSLLWGFQGLENDVWNMACRGGGRSGPNCPDPARSVLKDFDFGAQAIVATLKNGSPILLAGQKSGDVYGLSPADGKLLWRQRFGEGTPLGGVHWGMAYAAGRLFAPINDPGSGRGGEVGVPGINAVDIENGEVLWRWKATPDCSGDRQSRDRRCAVRYGLSAAPLVIDDRVIAAGTDGRLYAFDVATGKLTFEFDTLRDFDTVNGVKGSGGSIDSHSLFAGAGMLFVGSGYGSFGQPRGNVLLAFRAPK